MNFFSRLYYLLYVLMSIHIKFLSKIKYQFYLLFKKNYCKQKKNRAELQKNIHLQNKHITQVAMVIGTGPSALQVLELSELKHNIIITVNEGFLFLIQKNIHVDYVIINDDCYYEDEAKWEVIKQLFSLMSQYHFDVFLPLKHQDKIMQSFTQIEHDKLHFYDTFPNDSESIQWISATLFLWHESLPSMPTVMHFALILALYLGCKTTYLLGVDLDYMIAPTEPIRHCYDGMTGFYSSNQSCVDEYKNKTNWNFEELLQQTQYQLSCYRVIKKMFEKVGGSIVNLSKKSFLQEFSLGYPGEKSHV